ncbi:Aspartyl/glutamyl-tRNA(Asn/Gln) amidotransferase subunit B, partial [Geodia barretti]
SGWKYTYNSRPKAKCSVRAAPTTRPRRPTKGSAPCASGSRHLPVVNRKAVEYTIMTGLALGCRIPEYTKFDRKNYPYPDLMKGYQISQYDLPLALDGHLEFETGGQAYNVGIERVHLEEDVAKLHHHPSADGQGYSLVDVNRSGVPLMEVVSKPDMRSAEEAREYLTTLHSILQYLDVSTANLQDGSFRCDANISLRPKGRERLGSKAEVKNMNSFRSVFLALKYERRTPAQNIGPGEKGWVEERNATVSQRSKEQAHDYRYFPEPDLPPLTIDREWVEEIQGRLPELATQRRARFVEQYRIPEKDAGLLTNSKDMADFYERNGDDEGLAKSVSNWVFGDLSRLLNLENTGIGESKVTPDYLAELVDLVDRGEINTNTAKDVLEQVFQDGKSPAEVVAEKGYSQIDDSSVVEEAVAAAIEANPKALEDYRSGKSAAAKFLVGQVMKNTKGQAKPDLVNQLVEASLKAAS